MAEDDSKLNVNKLTDCKVVDSSESSVNTKVNTIVMFAKRKSGKSQVFSKKYGDIFGPMLIKPFEPTLQQLKQARLFYKEERQMAEQRRNDITN